ncbi:MAG: hypothetical protein IK015_12635 [Treponema sp.]|nr:hypothetical protein [Treponema sp.]
MKFLELAKNFRSSTRFALPRAVFMLMIYLFFCFFSSSVMTGIAMSASSFFLRYQNGINFAIFLFAFLELLSCAAIFILHYGLFLCNLRFARNQPVALSFLFVGFRQRRARRGAIFFVVPMILTCVVFAFIINAVDYFALPQFQAVEQVMEFIKNDPDSFRKLLRCYILFLVLLFFVFFPFTFVWSFVYDKPKQNFAKSMLDGLKFFGKRVFSFMAFEFVCHFRKAFFILAFNILHAFVYEKYQSDSNIYSLGSLISFASFALTLYTAASVILSIQYYYDKINEDSKEHSSN